jgi:hypothetical protein
VLARLLHNVAVGRSVHLSGAGNHNKPAGQQQARQCQTLALQIADKAQMSLECRGMQ